MVEYLQTVVDALKDVLWDFEKVVENCKALTFKPNQNQFDALVSFAYNCGIGNLNTLVKNRDVKTVSQKLLLYNKANGTVFAGLTRRRKAEKELFDNAVKLKVKSNKNKFITASSSISAKNRMHRIW